MTVGAGRPDGRPPKACAGAAGAFAGIRSGSFESRLPTSIVICGSTSFSGTCADTSSTIRGRMFCRTQSTTNLFGASNFSCPSFPTACRGRTQVLNCCSATSASRWRRQRFQSSSALDITGRGYSGRGSGRRVYNERHTRDSTFDPSRSLTSLTGIAKLCGSSRKTAHICLSGRFRHEAHLSAEHHPPQSHPRFPCAYGDEEGPAGPRTPPRQGPQAHHPVIGTRHSRAALGNTLL